MCESLLYESLLYQQLLQHATYLGDRDDSDDNDDENVVEDACSVS